MEQGVFRIGPDVGYLSWRRWIAGAKAARSSPAWRNHTGGDHRGCRNLPSAPKVPRLPGKQFDQRLGRRPTEFHRQLNGRTLSAKFGMRDKVLEEPLAILRKHRKRSDQHLGMLFPIRLQTGQALLGG